MMTTPNVQGSVIIQPNETTKCYGNAVIQADDIITVIIQTDDNPKYSRKYYYPAR
jgi:hypothetical protein